MGGYRLNRSLVLESAVRMPDGAGGYSETWVALGALWAAVQARSGRVRDGGAAPVSAVNWRIVVRAAPPGSSMRPAPGQRFRDGARVFAIRAVSERDGDGRYLLCLCDEEVAP